MGVRAEKTIIKHYYRTLAACNTVINQLCFVNCQTESGTARVKCQEWYIVEQNLKRMFRQASFERHLKTALFGTVMDFLPSFKTASVMFASGKFGITFKSNDNYVPELFNRLKDAPIVKLGFVELHVDQRIIELRSPAMPHYAKRPMRGVKGWPAECKVILQENFNKDNTGKPKVIATPVVPVLDRVRELIEQEVVRLGVPYQEKIREVMKSRREIERQIEEIEQQMKPLKDHYRELTAEAKELQEKKASLRDVVIRQI
ncbi:hypothetical protein phiAS5_ORF0219 [Aeromonas phage phiAS5]|uniref:Uncharacterized protein n=1 Tax=Aeromonas phage phiAS5 TaxID=879630 RepID=E1A1X3_9CAUD|nr:hypothetical protein phiAS5_ORF0219 [Aeromonas phage phiAS5]ADM80062.1 hypothetical protein phiAS5_ORF0219 [Aeromonas phage phiAS5]